MVPQGRRRDQRRGYNPARASVECLGQSNTRQTSSHPSSAPPGANPLSFAIRQSLTQDRFWQRMQDFIQPSDVVLADVGTSSAGTAGLRMPNGVAVIRMAVAS
jgi:indolepyruvate decarboxylase